ncbi:MAG: thermonuclease family protein [Candidatus Sungbacteria bacterium]|uniref:Thermonuclease family protein n=1 Tax=Candidatus Sungiibacteriota bacterium TaxID=2750080 RepID=A0A9D6LR40_9BACT|nr:thermonuclease family protein [Candidatus Sungbacteria bacterium]
MNQKIIYVMIGAAVVSGGILYASYYPAELASQFAKTATVYDESIKVSPGKAIKVAEVIDGDTIVLANGDHLRYIGMDTPEEVDPRKPVQCYAKEAADANRRLVQGKTIIFYRDVSEHDKYGRWLGYVYLLDGPDAKMNTFVNRTLVRSGFAFAYNYKPDTSKAALFKTDETAAKNDHLGLWAHCTVTRLSTGREQTNNL